MSVDITVTTFPPPSLRQRTDETSRKQLRSSCAGCAREERSLRSLGGGGEEFVGGARNVTMPAAGWLQCHHGLGCVWRRGV
jgi:hypothetical protein